LVTHECLGSRRIADLPTLLTEVRTWSLAADLARRAIDWSFRVSDARRTFRYGGLTTARSQY
jgi:hypothetical protein